MLVMEHDTKIKIWITAKSKNSDEKGFSSRISNNIYGLNYKKVEKEKLKQLKKSFLSVLILFSVFNLLTFGFIPKANASSINVNRLAGFDAYQTGATIANTVNSGSVDSVVLTSGITFQDALSGSVLAKQKNAPILLVNRSVKLSDEAFNYIKNHLDKDGTIYILGGTGIIPSEFETALNDLGYHNIIRRGGWDQYDTALLIAQEKQAPIGTPVVIAYGENLPDALSISSFAVTKVGRSF